MTTAEVDIICNSGVKAPQTGIRNSKNNPGNTSLKEELKITALLLHITKIKVIQLAFAK